jgi:hypothetical protein
VTKDQATAFGFSPSKPHEAQPRRHRQIDPHRNQAAPVGQGLGDHRRQAAAQDAAEVEGRRGAGVAHPGREQVGQEGAQRSVDEAHDQQADRQEGADGRQRAGHHHQRQQDADPDGHGAAGHQHPARAGGVGPVAGHDDAAGHEQDADQLGAQHGRAAIAQVLGAVAQREGGHQIVDGEAADGRQRPAEGGLPVVAQQLAQRHGRRRLVGDGGGEVGGLGQLQPHPQPHPDQGRAAQERQAPAPGLELVRRQDQAQDQEQAVGGDEADRRAQLREHAEPRAPARRRVLDRQQGRPAPLAAQAEALAEPQQAQQGRGQPAGRGVGGQEGDGQGRAAHQQQRGHQGRLAPHPVAEVAEGHRAERPGQEGHAQAGEGGHLLQAGRLGREEQLAEHQRGGGGVDVEVVELHRRAHQAGGQHAAVGIGRDGILAHDALEELGHGLAGGRRLVNRWRGEMTPISRV